MLKLACSASLSLEYLSYGDICTFAGRRRASQVVLAIKNSPANAGDIRDSGLIPGPGRSLGGGHANAL